MLKTVLKMENPPVEKTFFYSKLDEFYNDKRNMKKKPYTKDKMQNIMKFLLDAAVRIENSERRSNEQYYYGKLYVVIEIGGLKKLIKKRKTDSDPIIFLDPIEDFYDKLMDCHVSTGHGGRDKMKIWLKTKFHIPRTAIEVFIKCCKRCAEKKCNKKKGIVVKPIISKEWNHRGQVDLIDLQSTPDGEYKWLLNYQDHLTKFIHLRPLKSKRAEEVADEILKIFLEFGAPKILQSDNGHEFVNSLISQMIWPACKLIHGRPHPQSQGSVERSNQDVENMLRSWIEDNNSKNWSLGNYFVQWTKNSSHHRVIGRTPYKALFGVDFPVGLHSTNIPDEILENNTTEEELEGILEQRHQTSEISHDIADILLRSEDIDIENIPIVMSFDESLDAEIESFLNTPEGDSANQHNMNKNDTDRIMEVNDTSGDNASISGDKENEKRTTTCINCLGKINEPCEFCKHEKTVLEERNESNKGMKRAAEKMVENTRKKLKDFQIGDQVAIAVPKVDRGPMYPKNVFGVVNDTQNGVYQITTEHGKLNRWFSRDELTENTTQTTCSEAGGGPTHTISLRECLGKVSKFGGQGYKKCLCKPSKAQCETKRCVCFKNNMKCNSRCHHSGPCSNK